ncbi:AAA family ATPase [Guptibacillus algicola]|uniref:AAA family ATPase n=1 Tax=Guptibacillus algicola TaxID=225844 RepID=UPI001CD7E32D|nr:AAA family ATPase [Alkalihalobacillus algicola]MCA0987744.1 AAA family ATPase [Alkalihalobacillus algicola]
MKPLRLSVSGLHSFRESQVVDFEALCQGGVFGIFGPTGSGKSSLLDAMTLALYGKVERATNNTQGIMNHAEDTLSVSFTFELSEGVQYRVERSYKRSGDISVRSTTSRLVEITSEESILADKDRDVSQRIQEILGLTIDDFTRAVVLPQGKFAEFLSLKGTERRQMLQRLFQLEKYGDQFNRRLKARVDQEKSVLNELTAEQTGLGDASKEHLKEAKEALKSAEDAAEKATNELNASKKKRQHAERIWSLQQELTQLTNKKTSLLTKSDEVNELKTKIKHAFAASELKPYLDTLESTEKEEEEALRRFDQTKQQLTKATKRYEAAKKSYDDIRKKQQTEEPQLIKKLNDLERGIKLENDLTSLKKIRNANLEKSNKIEEESAEANNAKEQADYDLKVARSLQEDLNRKLENLQIPNEERKRLSTAQQLKQEYESVSKQLQETEEEEEKIKSEKSSLEASQNDMHDTLNNTKESYRSLFRKLLTSYEGVSSCKTAIDKRIARFSQTIHEAYQKLENSRTHAIAIKLASELQEGEACPVCGATEHVDLARGEDQTLEWQHKIEQTEQKREALKDSLMQGKQLQYKLEQLSDTMIDLDEGVREIKAEQKPVDLSEDLVTELKSFAQDVRELEEAIRSVGKDLQEYSSTVSKNSYRLDQVNRNLASLLEKKAAFSARVDELKRKIKEDLSLEVDEIEEEVRKLEKMDGDAEVLRERLSKSIPYIEEKEERSTFLQEKVQTLTVQKAEIKSTLHQNNEQVNRDERELVELVGEGSAQTLYQNVEEQLNNLRDSEKKAREELTKLEQDYQKAERQAAADENYVKDVRVRLEKASSSYEREQKESIFSNRESVRAQEVSKQSRSEWEEEVETYDKEWNRVIHGIEELETKLAGEKISEDEWKEAEESAREKQKARDDAHSQLAASRHHVEDVTKRHERFMELERDRKKTSEELEKLGKLQAVFRGNSFVEFIASEQLEQVSLDASQKLGDLTGQRYALEVDSSGGFLIRDDANGGVKRPVSTLSGGETFLTSLSLALALSGQIQLRGAHPLQFFFLDEGFGTLDETLLDTVITSLEKLQTESLSVGVISHVPELRARLPRKLVVTPSEPSGKGSRIQLETL